MAHRKPLGTTCSAHFKKGSWDREPELGDCLKSTAGTAYLIVGIAEGKSRIHYTLERIAETPANVWVFDFFWLSRDRAA